MEKKKGLFSAENDGELDDLSHRGRIVLNRGDRIASQLYIGEDRETQGQFIRTRSELHALQLQEEHKTLRFAEESRTKRLSIGLAVLLIAIAALVVTFAPADRQVFSTWVGAALTVVAAGLVGFGRFFVKAPGITITAEDPRQAIEGENEPRRLIPKKEP